MRKKYRYIGSGTAIGSDSIRNFRLVASNMIKPSYSGKAVIRVNIPNDLKLDKSPCDPYSTTYDIRTLEELGYDILVWNKKKGRWIIHNEYKGRMICDIPLIYREEF